jgi:hypothetical protein
VTWLALASVNDLTNALDLGLCDLLLKKIFSSICSAEARRNSRALRSFLHCDLPTLQRGLKFSLPQRLAKVVIHPCRKTLFVFSLQGVSRQGDDVDR